MSTTALTVEFLVIGYQALIWLVLIVFLFFPVNSHALLQKLIAWKELNIIVSVVTAYTLGAIINGITASVMEMKWLGIYKMVYKRKEQPSDMRAAILIRKPEAFMHIMKNFDIPRVLRSTIINVLLIGIFAFIHLYRYAPSTNLQLFLVVCIVIIVTGISIWAWYETEENFYIHLTKTYDEVMRKTQPNELE